MKNVRRAYTVVSNRLAELEEGSTVPKHRTCHMRRDYAAAVRCEQRRAPWYNEHVICTVEPGRNVLGHEIYKIATIHSRWLP